MTTTEEYQQQIAVQMLLDGSKQFLIGKYRIINLSDEDKVKLRLIGLLDEHKRIWEFGWELITSLFSETTNDDACEILIREISAHWEYHEDLKEYRSLEFGKHVVMDFEVVDSLS
jgi:hypothetical protein